MIVFPAIDLLAGKVVRLRRGDRNQVDVYSDDPAAVARDFADRGASWIHVVDLSAAFEEDVSALEANARAIASIVAVDGIKVDTRAAWASRGPWSALPASRASSSL